MKGVTRRGNRLRVYVKVGTGPEAEQRERTFPLGTPISTMKEWRRETEHALRELLKKQRHGAGSLGADITRYLDQVRAMPTFAQRERHLALWRDALGADTPRHTLTPADVRTVLQTWRTEHSAATCNKRRTALMHLFSVLDGKGAANPVRDVPKFAVDDPLPRGRDPHTLDAALTAAPRCASRACCRVILWTGARPVELNRAQPEDVDLQGKTAILRTAKGGRVRIVPLTKQGVAAWREFIAADCWQKVPQAAPLGRWLKQHTGLDDLRVYDLRHSYGTALARRETRLDVIGALMGHSTLELTRRYTLAAVRPDALAAAARLAKRLA